MSKRPKIQGTLHFYVAKGNRAIRAALPNTPRSEFCELRMFHYVALLKNNQRRYFSTWPTRGESPTNSNIVFYPKHPLPRRQRVYE